jgi:hypothetical protein
MFTVCHKEEAELLPPQLLPRCPVYDTILIWFLILFPVLSQLSLCKSHTFPTLAQLWQVTQGWASVSKVTQIYVCKKSTEILSGQKNKHFRTKNLLFFEIFSFPATPWWDSHKIGFMLHVKSDLNVLIRFYLDSNRWIGSDLQRLGTAWLGQEVSSGFALAARAVRLQCALAARARSQLLQKIYEFIHDNYKKYMNS